MVNNKRNCLVMTFIQISNLLINLFLSGKNKTIFLKYLLNYQLLGLSHLQLVLFEGILDIYGTASP